MWLAVAVDLKPPHEHACNYIHTRLARPRLTSAAASRARYICVSGLRSGEPGGCRAIFKPVPERGQRPTRRWCGIYEERDGNRHGALQRWDSARRCVGCGWSAPSGAVSGPWGPTEGASSGCFGVCADLVIRIHCAARASLASPSGFAALQAANHTCWKSLVAD